VFQSMQIFCLTGDVHEGLASLYFGGGGGVLFFFFCCTRGLVLGWLDFNNICRNRTKAKGNFLRPGCPRAPVEVNPRTYVYRWKGMRILHSKRENSTLNSGPLRVK